MSESKCVQCDGDTAEFDPKLAFDRLARKQAQLAEVLARFMSERAPPAGVGGPPPGIKALASAAPALTPPDDLMRVLARIVGGRPTAGFPDCCLIGHRNPNGTISWFCTGVLVHPQLVLTAGHCFSPTSRPNVVALATSDQNQLSHAELVNVRRQVVHPRYEQTKLVSDMTVLVLRNPAGTAPVTIATSPELVAATKCSLVGFGNEDINSTKGFGIKREVDVNLVSIRRAPADNLDADEHQYGYESDYEFVAGGEGFDTCNGDSGGPVYIDVGGTRKVCGLTSRGTEPATHACGDGGIYTRIDVHMDFVRKVADDAGITDL